MSTWVTRHVNGAILLLTLIPKRMHSTPWEHSSMHEKLLSHGCCILQGGAPSPPVVISNQVPGLRFEEAKLL